MLVALTFAVAYTSTNFDNLALFIALAPTAGVWRTAFAFASTQLVVVAAAVAVGTAADSLPAEWLGFLGVIPIALGIRGLWTEFGRKHDDTPPPGLAHGGLLAMTLIFGGMSADTFALTATLLADSADRFDGQVVGGAVFALICLCAAGALASRAAAKAEAVVNKLEKVTPFVMIASGLYILSDTVTDIV